MKCFEQITVTYFLSLLVLKSNVLPFLCPVYVPSELLHFFYKLFFADTIFQCF